MLIDFKDEDFENKVKKYNYNLLYIDLLYQL